MNDRIANALYVFARWCFDAGLALPDRYEHLIFHCYDVGRRLMRLADRVPA